MALQHCFECPLPEGVHARPASALEELARTFDSDVVLINQRTGQSANGKNVLAIIGADIRFHDPCLVTVSGTDEKEALAKITTFVENTLPHCDDAAPASLAAEGERPVPPGLRNAGVSFYPGKAVVPGIAVGRAVRAGGFSIPWELTAIGLVDPNAERQRLDAALEKVIEGYERKLASVNGIEAELIKAHRSIARDLEFRELLHKAVEKHGRTAAGAIADAEAHFHALFAVGTNTRLRDRTLDIQDVCSRLLREIYGSAAGSQDVLLASDSIVVAASLTPGQFLAMDRRFLKGLVLAQAGTTSHTVILARSFGIPTLTGITEASNGRLEDLEVILDADLGALVSNLTPQARRYYDLEVRRVRERRERLARFAAMQARTHDGCRLELLANILSADEADIAFSAGAEGIGLFRTEMLFLDRESPPTEVEQFEAYRQVASAAGGRPVVIRTLDIGGDKPLGYLNLRPEENPFLGYRAVRIYPEFEAMFRAQVQAVVRASAFGKVKMMLPMIATVDEVRWSKKIVKEEQSRCVSEGLACDACMPFGAMIEVPAAGYSIQELCAEVDFFSIGSNDLLQYFMAADRGNSRLASLYNPLQPAFLRFMDQIVRTVHAQDRKVGLCGEMGSDTRLLPLLAGLGLDSISAAASAIPALKEELARLNLGDCQRLVRDCLACPTADEVSRCIEGFAQKISAPLIDSEMIMVGVEASSREEAIKHAIDRLYVVGRTDDPLALEESVWQRERTYATGIGYGFAIPHCKTNAVRSNSLALLKLRHPVEWGALDGQPVRIVLLLAVREADGAVEHMRVLARLARQLMHEEFRSKIEAQECPEALCAFLKEAVQN